jgi:pimeloyl-ACP methyl ester carboxylesterase
VTREPATPFYFRLNQSAAPARNREGRDCWIPGFFHPARGGKGRSGAVLCNPFGSEQNCTYRCYRHIAERLSFAGVNVLRFDYYGTGNSPGADAEPSVVRAWLDSIHGAIDFLTDAAETEDLYLFGTRLGATLAAAVASERGDGTIKGLALWYPFDNGGDFSREILFAQIVSSRQGNAERTPARPPNSVREVSGFLLTDSMIEDLRRVDLLSIHRRPAPSALVLARRPSLPETRLVDHLRSLSVQTEHEFIPGITETMGAPDQTIIRCRQPSSNVSRIGSWT